MRGRIAALTGLTFLICAVTLQAQTSTAFRVLLGVTDSASTRWDGTITVKGAGDYSLEGWRFEDMATLTAISFIFQRTSHACRGDRYPSGNRAPWSPTDLLSMRMP